MATFKQEMPPKGGYDYFDFAKTQKPKGIAGKWLLLGFGVYTIVMLRVSKWDYHRRKRMPKIENRDADIAIEPIFQAERNRLFLKTLIDHRKYEAEIMKDEPGWINGTLYGSPVYHNKEVWIDPCQEEFYAHADWYKGYRQFLFERHYH